MKRCAVCERPINKDGEFLYYLPNEVEVWLCGKKNCSDRFEEGEWPKSRRTQKRKD
jgi:hypothetical protein